MKKLLFFFSLGLVNVSFLPSQTPELKESVLITRFLTGNSPDFLGVDYGVGSSFPSGPTSLAFNDEGNLYVNDALYNRIVVFGPDFSIVKFIDDQPYFFRMSVNSDGSFIGQGPHTYIESDPDGSPQILLKVEAYDVVKRLNKVGSLFFWQEDDGETYGYLNPGPDPDLNRISLARGNRVLSALAQAGAVVEPPPKLSGAIEFDRPGKPRVPVRPENQIQRVWFEGKLVSKRLRDLISLPPDFGIFEKKTGLSEEELKKKDFREALERDRFTYWAIDKDSRTYWEDRGGRYLILESDGTPLKYLSFDSAACTPPFVSQEGDFYYLKYVEEEKQLHLMKVCRDW